MRLPGSCEKLGRMIGPSRLSRRALTLASMSRLLRRPGRDATATGLSPSRTAFKRTAAWKLAANVSPIARVPG
jgi:hypothetical protein